MNLTINTGKQNNGDDVVLDFAKQNLNLILLIGSTGSGKSVFHSNLYAQLLEQNTPEELSFVLIDNTRVDFYNFPESYLIKRCITQNEAMAELVNTREELNRRSVGENANSKAIFVHIEECDQFVQDPKATEEFFREFIQLKQDSNIFVVYSTSRPSENMLPTWLIDAADLKVVFNLASETDCQRVLGNNLPLSFSKPGERILVLKNSSFVCQPLSIENCVN
jgi:DNA segregation ATPase FtsK/SpoIIIE-like protein